MNKRLEDFTTLTFDCYGTLIDWESGIWDALQPLLMFNRHDELNRAQALRAFSQLEYKEQARSPGALYGEILKKVHRSLARFLKLDSTDDLDRDFGASLPLWPAFPDSADALRRLKKRYRLVILSNVDRAGFEASSRKLGVEFDAVHTAQDIGSYKPDPRNFQYLLEHLGADFLVGADQVLHTAQSLYHDHVLASKFGLAKAWIDRQGLSDGGNWGATPEVGERPELDFVFASMSAMAEAAGL